MISLQVQGSSQIHTVDLDDMTSPDCNGMKERLSTAPSRDLDRLYTLSRDILAKEQEQSTSTSNNNNNNNSNKQYNNVVLSFVDPATDQRCILRFGEQLAKLRAMVPRPPVITIMVKRWSAPRRWKKGHIVGTGATGNVYVATSAAQPSGAAASSSESVFAVKEMMVDPDNSDELARKMREEMDLLMQLEPHRNIVRYYGMERTTCAINIFMEYIAGGSVRALLNRLQRPLHESVVRDYTAQILRGLQFLHEQHIVHGDIKGGNCLVDVDGTIKLADFGSAAKTGDEVVGLRGTSLWMSPECVKGEPLSPATDIWSLGCTVIEMATGSPPWVELNFTNEWAAMFYISQAESGPPTPSHLTSEAHEFLKLCFPVKPCDRASAKQLLAHPFVTTVPVDYVDPTVTVSSGSATPSRSESPSSVLNSSLAFLNGGGDNSNSTMRFNVIDPETPELPDTDDHLVIVGSHPPLSGAGGYTTPRGVSTRTNAGGASSGLSLPSISVHRITPPQRNSNHNANAAPSAAPTPRTEANSDAVQKALLSSCDNLSNEAPVRSRLGNTLSTLPEPVLLSILLYLTPRALCRVSQVNRDIHVVFGNPNTGEVLWKKLFIKSFGEVDVVRANVRRGWKAYFADSARYRGALVGESLRFTRRLTHSRCVFEGIDDMRRKVVLVVEPSSKSARCSSSQGNSSARMSSTPGRRTASTTRSPGKSQQSSSFGMTMTSAYGAVIPISPMKESLSAPGLPNLTKMRTASDLAKAQRIRQQHMDHVMSSTSSGGSFGSTGSGGGSFRGPPSTGHPFGIDLYDTTPLLSGSSVTPCLGHYYRVSQYMEDVAGVVHPIAFLESCPSISGRGSSPLPSMNNVLALPYLGTDLNELLLLCGNRFSTKTVCQLALQLVDILEDLHRRELLHYCITPSHIVVSDTGKVTLINFKYARAYSPSGNTGMNTARRPTSSASQRHKESVFFMSAYAQKGLTPGPRDDAIALGHVLCYLVHGGLPWIRHPRPADQELYDAKKNYVQQLSTRPPLQFYHFLRLCNDLRQGEVPDYAFLRNMIHRLMNENQWACDGVFDWSATYCTAAHDHPSTDTNNTTPATTTSVGGPRGPAEPIRKSVASSSLLCLHPTTSTGSPVLTETFKDK